jgi:hypothetical protein
MHELIAKNSDPQAANLYLQSTAAIDDSKEKRTKVSVSLSAFSTFNSTTLDLSRGSDFMWKF